ncbi:MAG: hypothetical protein M1827_001910 [Pycnora praestabilis]|nr:MAG: hypothetical protein M1827_001910 [Pycnora praestabilis]
MSSDLEAKGGIDNIHDVSGARIGEGGSNSSIENEKSAHDVKTTKDGQIILNPQPSDDRDDPLNWSWVQKHKILFALFIPALLTDAGMTWGSTQFEAQAATWHMMVPAVADSLSGGIFLQGPGGLLVVPLTQRYGRLPVLFWSQALSFIVVIAAAFAPTYAGFTACRTLQGFFNTAPQVIGLSMIHDIFYYHEYARKINIWAFGFIVGPYLGPFISGLLIEKLTWRDNFAILACFYALSAIIIVILADETLYDRRSSTMQSKPTGGFRSKLQRLVGTAGLKARGRPSLWTVSRHLAVIFFRPQVLVPSISFYMVIFMWAIGLNTTVTQLVKPPPFLFTDQDVALLYLAPMIGALLGQIWGRFFNDWLVSAERRNSKDYKPEVRLWGCWPAVLLAVAALVLIGEGLEKGLSWVSLAMGWGIYSFATLAATVAVSAYALDCFPEQAAAASSIVNLWRTTGGFCVVYFQLVWVVKSGAAVTFGSQAGIVAAAFFGIIATQYWGPSWRQRFPAPAAEN